MTLLVIIFVASLFLFKIWKSRQNTINTEITADISAETTKAPSTSQGYSFPSEIPEIAPRKQKKSNESVIARVINAASTHENEEPIPPISQNIFARNEADPAVSEELLPYGQLITCQLANTIESTHIDTPIFRTVIEDVYGPAGNLIIPTGTEIHGDALKSSARDRIGIQNKFVWHLTKA